MMPSPNHSISIEKATDLLRSGQPLVDCYIGGELTLPPGETWDQEVVFENCVVENFSCLSISFGKPVELRNCLFNNCQFTFSYFLGGLSIDTCCFDSYLDFQAGGHNQGGKPIRIVNSQFSAFVNFFDCWYESAVIITDNHFPGGTNLLGKPHNIAVTFDVAPLLARNSGQLAVDGEHLSPHLNG
jgi:hypothetical protein